MNNREPKPITPSTNKPREAGKAVPRGASMIVRTGVRGGPYEFL